MDQNQNSGEVGKEHRDAPSIETKPMPALDAEWCDDCHGYTHVSDCPSVRIASKQSLVEKVVDAVYRSMAQYEDGTWFLDQLKAKARVSQLLANGQVANTSVSDGTTEPD